MWFAIRNSMVLKVWRLPSPKLFHHVDYSWFYISKLCLMWVLLVIILMYLRLFYSSSKYVLQFHFNVVCNSAFVCCPASI
jgi:hypothetical protein